MTRPIVQIYEIQTPDEARALIELGVDHIGSVITTIRDRHDPVIRETVSTVRRMGAVSCLIPLYTNPAAVFDTLDHCRPHIIHFCDTLNGPGDGGVQTAIDLQAAVKHRFPDIRIMRSIPIGQTGRADAARVVALAARLEPWSDFFLTDTIITNPSATQPADQPVVGFVGITGQTCDWSVAAALVANSRIPVILAGGVSPENVADGIRQVQPYGVDSCTCTNAVGADGRPVRFQKDLSRVKQLLAETDRAARVSMANS